MPDAKLEVLRYQLGISYAVENSNKASIKNLINYLRIISLKEKQNEAMLLNAIDNLIRKAKLITNDDQKRIALLLSPIMQLQIKKNYMRKYSY